MSNLPPNPNDTGYRSWPASTWIVVISTLLAALSSFIISIRTSNRTDVVEKKAVVAAEKAETNTANIATIADATAKVAEAPKGNWPTTADAKDLKAIAADPSQVPAK